MTILRLNVEGMVSLLLKHAVLNPLLQKLKLRIVGTATDKRHGAIFDARDHALTLGFTGAVVGRLHKVRVLRHKTCLSVA